jgi:hypothetical protein
MKIPSDAVLLIPELEHEGDAPRFGIKAGYYNKKQLVALISNHRHEPDAIQFIADMLETGDAGNDGFAVMLRDALHDPKDINRIVKICRG